MIKLLGCLMVAGASVLMALNYIKNLRVRVKGLRAMIEFFTVIRIKINYELLSIPELIRGMKEKSSYPISVFLSECVSNLDKGKELKEAWHLAIKSFSKQKK